MLGSTTVVLYYSVGFQRMKANATGDRRGWSCDDRFCVAALFMWLCRHFLLSLYIMVHRVSLLLSFPPPPSPLPHICSLPLRPFISGDLPRDHTPYPTTNRRNSSCPPRSSSKLKGGIPPGPYSFPTMLRSLERTICSSPSVDQSITSSTWIRIQHPLRISHCAPPLNSQR